MLHTSWSPYLDEEQQAVNKRTAFSRDEPANWLSGTEWSALEHRHSGNMEGTEQAVVFIYLFIYKTVVREKWFKKAAHLGRGVR